MIRVELCFFFPVSKRNNPSLYEMMDRNLKGMLSSEMGYPERVYAKSKTIEESALLVIFLHRKFERSNRSISKAT